MSVLKQILKHKILLDTHIWLWLIEGNKKIKPAFRKSIEIIADQEHVMLSAISVWEISMLEASGKISLDRDCLDWVDNALNIPGFHLLPISPKIAIQSTRLPKNHVKDPADKMIVATAHEHNSVLITHDQKLLKYGKGHYINVHDPCS